MPVAADEVRRPPHPSRWSACAARLEVWTPVLPADSLAPRHRLPAALGDRRGSPRQAAARGMGGWAARRLFVARLPRGPGMRPAGLPRMAAAGV